MNLIENKPSLMRYLTIPFVLGGLVLCITGVSLFKRPDFELSYSRETLTVPCAQKTCVTILTLRLGNTGKLTQAGAQVSVQTSIETTSLNGVKVQNSAKVPQKFEATDSGNVTTYTIDTIMPGHRVDLSWIYSNAPESIRPNWDTFLVQVAAQKGKVQEASPEVTTFGRFLLQFLNVLN